MILDNKFNGILEQEKGHLVVYESSNADKNYGNALEVISNLGQVVDALSGRAKRINVVEPKAKESEEKDKAKDGKEKDKIEK